jgi:hypothetical protein
MLAAALVALGLVAAPGAVALPGRSGQLENIILANAPIGSGLAGVKDNVNQAGQPVWTIGSSGNGTLWVEFSVGSASEFQDFGNPALCMGEDNFAVVLRTCGNATTFWSFADDGNGFFFINNYRSNVQGRQYVLSAPNPENFNRLTLKPRRQTGQWQSWF